VDLPPRFRHFHILTFDLSTSKMQQANRGTIEEQFLSLFEVNWTILHDRQTDRQTDKQNRRQTNMLHPKTIPVHWL